MDQVEEVKEPVQNRLKVNPLDELSVRRICLHCASRNNQSLASDDAGVTIGQCDECGLPVCNFCADSFEQCPLVKR